MIRWAILSGEYPPQPGGVADYSRLLAIAMQKRVMKHTSGSCLQSIRPATLDSGAPPARRVRSSRHPATAAELASLEKPYRTLVQYVPHAFGWKAMNVPFCVWLFNRRRRERIWVMFHEVAYPISREQSLRHNTLGCVTRLMASLASRAAERCLVSTPAWSPLVEQKGQRLPIEWLPVPSNLSTQVSVGAITAVRANYVSSAAQVIVGHFGTYGSHIAPVMEAVLPLLLAGGAGRIGLVDGAWQ